MCYKCQLKPVYEFTNKRRVCKTCYIRWFEKKVLYTIRKFNLLKKGDIVGYSQKNDFRSVVLEAILKMLAKNGRIEVMKLDSSLVHKKEGGLKITKLAVPSTTDLESYQVVSEILYGDIENLNRLKPLDKKTIKPLYLFLDKEVELYANLRGLDFKRYKKQKDKVSSFIDELEKSHPEIKRSIINGLFE